jgi:hypothetical protein
MELPRKWIQKMPVFLLMQFMNYLPSIINRKVGH